MNNKKRYKGRDPFFSIEARIFLIKHRLIDGCLYQVKVLFQASALTSSSRRRFRGKDELRSEMLWNRMVVGLKNVTTVAYNDQVDKMP